jgi:hypothetical protein
VALVARSLPDAKANSDRGAPYIDLRKVSAVDGLLQGIVRHRLAPSAPWENVFELPY